MRGRVDCRCDATGRPQFLEVNPLAGLHPVLGDLVILAGLVGVGYEAVDRVDRGVGDASG